MFRKPPAKPVEERHAEPPPDRVADRVADHSADHRGNADTDRVDGQVVMRRHQRRADQHDLAGKGNAQALNTDHTADHKVDREWRNRVQQSLHIHASRMPDRRSIRAVMSPL